MNWDCVAELKSLEGWSELPGNGFGAVIAAAAGPELIGRFAVEYADFTTRVTVITHRRVRMWTEPRTADDQNSINEDVNAYLVKAGLAARPSGYRWFLLSPVGWEPKDDVVEAISQRINASDALAPIDVLSEANAAVDVLFQRNRALN